MHVRLLPRYIFLLSAKNIHSYIFADFFFPFQAEQKNKFKIMNIKYLQWNKKKKSLFRQEDFFKKVFFSQVIFREHCIR